MARRNIAYNQIGQKFTVYPTNDDDPANIIPLDLTNYSQAHILIRQPDGSITAYPATVIGAAEDKELVGVRVDAEPPIDDTHINDGNDGAPIPGSTTNVSVSPLNTAGKDTYVEIPPGGTLTFDDGSSSFAPNTIWVFFQGQPNARIILRMHSSDGTVSFQSGELSPSAANDAIDAGLSGTSTDRATQSIENTGTETAYYAGWVGRDDGTVPTGTGNRNFSNGVITIPEIDRAFTSITVGKGQTLVLKRATVQPNTDNLLLYVRGAALPSLRLHYYKANSLQGTSDLSGIDEPLSIPIVYEFDELHIEVLDDTNGVGIELGGISIQDGNGTITQILDWTEALITSPAIFPFDEDLNTDTNVTDGVWFFESIGEKTMQSAAITRPLGTVDNPIVSFEIFLDGQWMVIKEVAPELTDTTPTLIAINDIPRIYDHVRLVSTAPFQLHELNIEGKKNTNLATPTVEYIDSTGILTQKGPLEFWADIEFKDGTDRKSTQRAMRWVV